MKNRVGFCTLAIHAPYRERARRLFADAPDCEWTVLTDDPKDFAGLPVVAVSHEPTGPMAVDYINWIGPTGNNNGAAAYHDKRFALMSVLERFESAIFMDADSRLGEFTMTNELPPGLAVFPLVQRSIAEHLELCGTWRRPAFVELAKHLTGSEEILHRANWCHETCMAVTKDGSETRFFEAWDAGAKFMNSREMYSGEGGVIGLAAELAGWKVNFNALDAIESALRHEGGGPKS